LRVSDTLTDMCAIMVLSGDITIQSKRRSHWVDVTSEVRKFLSAAHVMDGLCTVSSLHTTGGVTINENADPDVERDFFWKLDQLVPRESSFRHSEGNSDSHIKASLVGLSVQVPVRDGELVLGTWQSIYFCEFDGPRARRLCITLIGE